MEKQDLTKQDSEDLEALLGNLLDAYKAGKVDKEQAMGTMTHVIDSLTTRNYDEIWSLLQQWRDSKHD